MTRPAVFLDRDGTLNRERGYIADPRDLEVWPTARNALKRLDHAGWPLVVVTNQGGLAFGLYSPAVLARIHADLHAALDGLPRGYFHCPHHTEAPAGGGYEGPCACRKPADGMLRQAARVLDLSLAGSVIIGDSARDLLMARGHGMRTVLVRSGKPWHQELEKLVAAGAAPHTIVDDIGSAADWLLDPAR